MYKSDFSLIRIIPICTLMFLCLIIFTLPGCNRQPAQRKDGDRGQQDEITVEAAATTGQSSAEKPGEDEGFCPDVPPDLTVNNTENDYSLWEGKLPPNELGEIMILMYHEIGCPEAEWCRTPENFRRDMQNLYDDGYRPVSLDNVVEGKIDIPAGTSPVVLTFDDSTRGQLNCLEENGKIELDPDCAVAMLEEFYAAHSDFGLAATFYIYFPNPFRQQTYIEDKLNYLVDRGFDIGNHTYGHANLSRLGPAEIQRELGLHQKYTEQYVPGYTVRSLALPYSGSPREHAELLLEGSYEGTSYSNEAVLLVGSNPTSSPFHTNFNPARLPRVRASEMKTEGMGMYEWLERFAENPGRRYVSDGNPDTITIPRELMDSLDENRVGSRAIVVID